MIRYRTRKRPVTPMRTFVPTEDSKKRSRDDDIDRTVYCCVERTRKLASGVCSAASDENPRVPRQSHPRAVRRSRAAWRSCVQRRRSRRDRPPPRRPDRRRQGADPRRRPRQGRRIGFAIGLDGPQVGKAVKLMASLYGAFVATDASLVEINPLVVTAAGDLLALDAKVNFDDNALYRHQDLRDLRDLGEEDPLEIEASKFSLNYIHLDGNIGCMVNGAGLAMATMDIIKLAGGEPANLLDVGGGANAEQIRNAFSILISDKNVKAALMNIIGGMHRCGGLGQDVSESVKELGV